MGNDVKVGVAGGLAVVKEVEVVAVVVVVDGIGGGDVVVE